MENLQQLLWEGFYGSGAHKGVTAELLQKCINKAHKYLDQFIAKHRASFPDCSSLSDMVKAAVIQPYVAPVNNSDSLIFELSDTDSEDENGVDSRNGILPGSSGCDGLRF
jgi:hypothetical protein